MNKQAQAVSDDMGVLAADTRALMVATAEEAGEKIGEARDRLAAALGRGSEMCGRVRDRALEGVKATDQAVHLNPYPVVGVAFAVGVVIAYLVARRSMHNGH